MGGQTAPTQAHLPSMEEHARDAAQLLKAMANEHRLLILCRLAEAEMSVGELNARIELSQSALSQHLSVLREYGLVATRREAQTIYYRVAGGAPMGVIQTLYDVFCAVPRGRRRR